MNKASQINADEVRKSFFYDPETGIFTHRDKRLAKKDTAGTVNKRPHSSYSALCINYRKVYAHRAAWMFMYGDIDQELVIDHIDGNGLNNRINNLRLVTKEINQRNRKNKLKLRSLSGVHSHRGGYTIYFLGKYTAWVKDFFEACCLRKSLESKNHFIN